MRFRLRTLLIVFLLLCLSAPWWKQVSAWLTPTRVMEGFPAPESRVKWADAKREIERIKNKAN